MLEISGLVKTFTARDGSTVRAVNEVSLGIEQGRLLTLLGPSGCGKTTILRCVAGLERPDSGRIVIGGETVFDSEAGILVPANRRGIGMVFQSYAIWPHMTVFENVAFPLRVSHRRRFSNAEVRTLVERALKTVRLGGFGNRSATQLSGGQQQRLALARGLVHEPKLLLLDEPLSNLDAKLREQMRFELKRLQYDLGITTLYVTHDQSEALALSDEVAVMNAGHVLQHGAPNAIYHHPGCEFVADFLGSTNFIAGTVETISDTAATVRTARGVLSCAFADRVAAGDRVVVVTRPENVALSGTAPAGAANTFAGTVANRIFLGEAIDYLIEAGGDEIRVRARPEWDFRIGDAVHVTLPPEKCVGLIGNEDGSLSARGQTLT